MVCTCRSPDLSMEVTEVTLVLTQRAKNSVTGSGSRPSSFSERFHDLVIGEPIVPMDLNFLSSLSGGTVQRKWV